MDVVPKFTKLHNIEKTIEKIGKFNSHDQRILLEFLRTIGIGEQLYKDIFNKRNREEILSLAKEILENNDNLESFYAIYRQYLDTDEKLKFSAFFLRDLYEYKKNIKKVIENSSIFTDFQAIVCHMSNNMDTNNINIMAENAELLVLVRDAEERGYFTALKDYKFYISEAEIEVKFNIDRFFNKGILTQDQYDFLGNFIESDAYYLTVLDKDSGEENFIYAQKDMRLTREVNICIDLSEITNSWKVDMKNLMFKY